MNAENFYNEAIGNEGLYYEFRSPAKPETVQKNSDGPILKDMLKNDEIQGNKEPLHEAYAAIRRESGNEVDTGNRVFQHALNHDSLEFQEAIEREEFEFMDGDTLELKRNRSELADQIFGMVQAGLKARGHYLPAKSEDLLSEYDELRGEVNEEIHIRLEDPCASVEAITKQVADVTAEIIKRALVLPKRFSYRQILGIVSENFPSMAEKATQMAESEAELIEKTAVSSYSYAKSLKSLYREPSQKTIRDNIFAAYNSGFLVNAFIFCQNFLENEPANTTYYRQTKEAMSYIAAHSTKLKNYFDPKSVRDTFSILEPQREILEDSDKMTFISQVLENIAEERDKEPHINRDKSYLRIVVGQAVTYFIEEYFRLEQKWPSEKAVAQWVESFVNRNWPQEKMFAIYNAGINSENPFATQNGSGESLKDLIIRELQAVRKNEKHLSPFALVKNEGQKKEETKVDTIYLKKEKTSTGDVNAFLSPYNPDAVNLSHWEDTILEWFIANDVAVIELPAGTITKIAEKIVSQSSDEKRQKVAAYLVNAVTQKYRDAKIREAAESKQEFTAGLNTMLRNARKILGDLAFSAATIKEVFTVALQNRPDHIPDTKHWNEEQKSECYNIYKQLHAAVIREMAEKRKTELAEKEARIREEKKLPMAEFAAVKREETNIFGKVGNWLKSFLKKK